MPIMDVQIFFKIKYTKEIFKTFLKKHNLEAIIHIECKPNKVIKI